MKKIPELFLHNAECNACSDNAVHIQNMFNRIKETDAKLENALAFIDQIANGRNVHLEEYWKLQARELLKELSLVKQNNS